MKCPKCGEDIKDEPRKIIADIDSVDDVLCVWRGKTTFLQYIHFGCPKAETPNFIFYVDVEEEEKEKGEG